MFDPAAPPLTVKPRKPYSRKLALIVIAPDGTFVEETAEIGSDPIPALESYSPALIVCIDTERFLLAADTEHRADKGWNWRLIASEHVLGTGELAQVREDHLVSYCGFKRGERTHYHYPISPRQYGRHSLADIGDDSRSAVSRLYEWGNELRAFAEKYSLRPSPTAGGMAAQLLRDKRFYPKPRRKVPKATNERCRPHLPGNHYELAAVPGKLYAAAYVLDQEAAHHSAAATIDLPDSDTLYASGHWRKNETEKIWAQTHELDGMLGLVKVRAFVPPLVAHAPWVPRYLSRAGKQTMYLYTNEIQDALSLGIDIYGAVGGWLAEKPDAGIKRYAEWAIQERKIAPRWIKGTLLSAYGILGAKPRHVGGYYRQAKRGEKVRVWLESEQVKAVKVMSEKLTQSPVAHLIQRGMIEAEVRRLTLKLARELETSHEIKVYSVMADAVITEGRKPLPLLPQPFRVKERLSWVRFRHSQAYEGVVTFTSHFPNQMEVA